MAVCHTEATHIPAEIPNTLAKLRIFMHGMITYLFSNNIPLLHILVSKAKSQVLDGGHGMVGREG